MSKQQPRPMFDAETVTVADLDPDNSTVAQYRDLYRQITGRPLTGTRKEKAHLWLVGMVEWRNALRAIDDANGHNDVSEQTPPTDYPTAPEPAPADLEDQGEPTIATDDEKREAAVEEASTALAVRGDDLIPEPSRWQQMMEMSQVICRGNLAPKAVRGNASDVAIMLLAANDLGIRFTHAMTKLFVVDGKLTMSAEMMVALVRREGHVLTVDPGSDATGCIVHGMRADNGQQESAEFTWEEAKTAELTSKDNWKHYPADMLYARAVSRLCRRLFPDVLGGISYTPEELGDAGPFDAPDQPATQHQPEQATATLADQQTWIVERIEALSDEGRSALRSEWKKRGLPKPTSLSVGAMRTAKQLLDQAEAAEPDEAEVAETPGADLDAAADDATERDDIDDAEVLPDDEAAVVDAAVAALGYETCAVCDLPIQPGLVDAGLGPVMQPVWEPEGSPNAAPHHAECAPF